MINIASRSYNQVLQAESGCESGCALFFEAEVVLARSGVERVVKISVAGY